MQNLENLIIVDNKNLSEINGLSELRHLNKIIIVGNNIKEVDDINSYAYNTKKSQMNILDVNMYHYFHREKFDVSNSTLISSLVFSFTSCKLHSIGNSSVRYIALTSFATPFIDNKSILLGVSPNSIT